MDFFKIAEHFQSYPAFFRYAVIAWIFFTALLLIGFLTLREPAPAQAGPPGKPVPQPKAQGQPVPRVANALDGTTLEAHRKRMAELDGHFAELDAYKRSLIGAEVAWSGAVIAVSNVNTYANVYLYSGASRGTGRFEFFAELPGEPMHRALALRREDLIQVQGTIQRFLGDIPVLTGTNFKLLPKSS